MATTFKTFQDNDKASTRTLLHEAIPITGTIVSGTYADANIKNFSSNLVQQVYDYPYLSSSANHIFDITAGYASDSSLSSSAVTNGVSDTDIKNKINMYNEMAQVLMGHDVTGTILQFDQDGDLGSGGTKLKEIYVLNFARLLCKDEIKKGTFNVKFGGGATYASPFAGGLQTITDYNAENEYRVNSPAGEYGILYTSSADIHTGSGVGLLYYQAGIAVLSASVFESDGMDVDDLTVSAVLSGSNIIANANSLRHRLNNLSFNNTTELNSKIYFCRVNHNEYNYSSNPTYLSQSKIIVKGDSAQNAPVTYPTTVGLYSADNALMAVAKLSEPLKKDPNNELILRVRLDY